VLFLANLTHFVKEEYKIVGAWRQLWTFPHLTKIFVGKQRWIRISSLMGERKHTGFWPKYLPFLLPWLLMFPFDHNKLTLEKSRTSAHEYKPHTYFFKHHCYKHRQPDIWPKNEHHPSTSPSLTSISTYNFSTQWFVFFQVTFQAVNYFIFFR